MSIAALSACALFAPSAPPQVPVPPPPAADTTSSAPAPTAAAPTIEPTPPAPAPIARKTPKPKRPPMNGGRYFENDGPGAAPPADLDKIPDARPRNEALASWANRPYTIMGKRYVPQREVKSFKQRGVASWYGRKFHGHKTAIGERYDMYAMTAAHPTLPLPSYAKVTNATTGASVIVRVNDRGPFLNNRVIDLSYTAAAKLGYVDSGFTEVVVEQIAFNDADAPQAPVQFANADAATPANAATAPASTAATAGRQATHSASLVKGSQQLGLTEASSAVEQAQDASPATMASATVPNGASPAQTAKTYSLALKNDADTKQRLDKERANRDAASNDEPTRSDSANTPTLRIAAALAMHDRPQHKAESIRMPIGEQPAHSAESAESPQAAAAAGPGSGQSDNSGPPSGIAAPVAGTVLAGSASADKTPQSTVQASTGELREDSVSNPPAGVYVQMAAFLNLENARWARAYLDEHLQEATGTAFAIHEQAGWYKVRAGPFATRAEAQQARAAIARLTDFEPIIATRPATR